MAIGGTVSENKGGEFKKRVGLFKANVIAVNPTIEQFKKTLGIELKEDSKVTDYTKEDKDGNTRLFINFWLEDVDSDPENRDKYKVTYIIDDVLRTNKDGDKYQFINSIGITSWASDESELPEWFTKNRKYRKAKKGEEELYIFLRKWHNKLDFFKEDAELQLDWKKLMKGDVREIKDQIGSEFTGIFVALATIKTVEKENEDGSKDIKEYQDIYNKEFFNEYDFNKFSITDFTKQENIEKLKTSKPKPFEYSILNLTGQYGCKAFYILKPIQDYNSSMNISSSDDSHKSEDDDSDY